MRVGFGFDVHRFETGRKLVLGGVDVPHDRGLAGHSDADVLCHAVGDALLGAAGLGDLGSNFPGDETWKDASSIEILRIALGKIRAAGWTVANLDATVIAEAPRLSPYQDSMRAGVAGALEVALDAVSVKITSVDGLGSIGRGEGIASMAVALLVPLG